MSIISSVPLSANGVKNAQIFQEERKHPQSQDVSGRVLRGRLVGLCFVKYLTISPSLIGQVCVVPDEQEHEQETLL